MNALKRGTHTFGAKIVKWIQRNLKHFPYTKLKYASFHEIRGMLGPVSILLNCCQNNHKAVMWRMEAFNFIKQSLIKKLNKFNSIQIKSSTFYFIFTAYAFDAFTREPWFEINEHLTIRLK